jgi:phosphonate transport system ATP-binding protein
MPSPSDKPVLELDRLGKAYAPGHFAIRGISLNVRHGEYVVIIGRSGAGKSTLLRCINLLTRPTEGAIRLAGTDVTHASGARLREVRGRVGMIFQGFNLVRRLSVLQNVLAGRLRFRSGVLGSVLATARWLPSRERDIAYSCLERVGIGHLAFRRADALSGGQQQRVAIARVLAQEPDVILADEPIASLDPLSAAGVMEALGEIRASRGIPVIVNLHQVEVAREFASRIIGMAAGAIMIDVPAAELDEREVDRLYRKAIGAGLMDTSDAASPQVEIVRSSINPPASSPSTSLSGVSA